MHHYRLRLALVALLTSACTAGAQDWPTRPLTLVVPYAAGGPTDAVGRLVAQRLSEVVRQQVVVENVGGAGGMTGSNRVAHAVPDGYQILFGGGGNLTYNQSLYRKPLFNSLTDFTPVILMTEQPLVLLARKDLPADNLQDFIRYLKAHTDASFGSAGVGSSSHLACLLLNLAIGANVAHVPYRGVAPAMQDLVGGRIDYICDIIPDVAAQIQGGAVKPIAILSRVRSAMLPDLATAHEQGLVDFETAGWYGLFLPGHTPPAIVQKLHDAGVAALDHPPFRERLHKLGVETVAPERRSSEYLARFLKEDIEKWAVPIKASGMTVD
jgi:tripartite-type tricarboxylate transporter receptor subunit TctC